MMTLRRHAVSAALFVLLSTGLFSEPAFVGYVTYSPQDKTAQVKVTGDDLNYVAGIGKLLADDATSFLARLDADHWMALTRKGNSWLLQIHDETNQYNFRALISAQGAISVQKGVDWTTLDPAGDANRAAELAVGYLQRARTDHTVFMVPPTGALINPLVLPPHAATTTAPVAQMEAPLAQPVTDDVWQRLVEGNNRFVSGNVLHPNQTMARIAETAQGQKPFAIVVTCSDSRVPPELLFDQGFGDLFVIRTAGEVVTEVELGSIEYAVEHLGAQYIVVMGHKRCGAVDATIQGGELPPNIEAIAEQIRPAVESARFLKGDLLDNAVRENVKLVLKKIKGDSILSQAFKDGKLNFKAAYYDLDTAKVSAL